MKRVLCTDVFDKRLPLFQEADKAETDTDLLTDSHSHAFFN